MSGPSPLEAAGPDSRVAVVYTPDDLARGQYLFFWTHVKRRRTRVAYAIIGGLALLGFAWLLWPLTGSAWVALGLFALALPFAMVGLPWLIVRATGYWGARRALRRQVDLPGEHEFAWTQHRLVLRSRYGTSDIPWADFVEIAENPRLWLLFISDRMYYLVPKRALTPAQSASFAQALAAGRQRGAAVPAAPARAL